MKPFNLEEAKAGKPICTRGGKPARIICFDKAGDGYPIVALIDVGDVEELATYPVSGLYEGGSTGMDLFMAPVQRTVWVNLYASNKGRVYPWGECGPTEEAAKQNAVIDSTYVGTYPITYEE